MLFSCFACSGTEIASCFGILLMRAPVDYHLTGAAYRNGNSLTALGGTGAAALSIGVNRSIAFVGAVNTTYGVAFGFNYKVPAQPRLVSSMSYGGALDEAPFDLCLLPIPNVRRW